jgi:UDP-2-acetamido-3-amino-2,3-dideoxy-glucuronate N-acetyltransferase
MKDTVLIGLGSWGNNIAKVLVKKKKLYGVIDLDKNINHNFLKNHKIKKLKFPDLRNKFIKNCFITTPSHLHFKHALTVLKYNKNIFIEKPLCFSEIEIKKIIKEVRKNNKVFMVGYLLLFHPALQKLNKIIKNKKILLIKSIRTSSGKIRFKDNVLWNLGIHDISYLINLVKLRIKNIKAINLKFLKKSIDESSIAINFSNNLKFLGNFSWISDKKNQKIQIQTEKKLYVFDDLSNDKLVENEIKFLEDNHKNKRLKIIKSKKIKFNKISPLENEINFFYKQVRNNKNYNNLDLTLNLTKILEKLTNKN